MKKLLVSVLAIAGLVACTQETTLVQKGNAPMEFGGAFVENATRANAAVDPSTTTESITGFDVWGFMDSPEGVVFEDEDVTGETGNFTYTNTQYWIPGHTYYFAALAPMNSANWDLNTANASKLGAGVVTFENINGTEDLLYAATSVDATTIKVGEAPVDKVKFQFSHLLSKVKFSFTNGFDNDNAYIDVKNIKMVAPSKATIDLAVENWWDNDDWQLVDAVPVTLEFGNACAKTAVGVQQVTNNERLTIPAAATQSYKVTFEVALYFGDVCALTKTLESNIENVALEMGKAYNFKATLDETNIAGEDGQLVPIVFDVEEVKEWENAAEQDITVDGYITNMVLDADYAANEMVKIAGNLNGNGFTLSAVDGVNYVVSNTARLIETKDDSIIENIKIDGKGVYTDKYGIRGIYTTGTGNVVVKNAEILNCTYAINANNAGTISVIDSTLQGWNSYGGTTKCLFENVKFIDGEFHNFRPYNNTVCKNCDFGAGVVIDLSEFIGTSIEFENCTVAGRPLTAADVTAPKNAAAEVIINLVVTEAPKKDGLVQNIENVENMTIDGGNLRTEDNKALRGIYITKGGVYNVKNVIVKNVVYAINVSTNDAVTLNVEDTTLEGWTSFGESTTATFKNVKFECGQYANFKAHTSAVLEGCSFEAGFMIDFEEIEAGETLTFKNCTYNGQPMTEESFINGTVKIDGDFTGKIAF